MDDSCLPEYADARKIFLQDQELSGRVALADLNKLDGILSSDKGSLIANLRFFSEQVRAAYNSGKSQSRD